MAYTGDRATVFQTIKIAPETTKGTAPTAIANYKKLSALGWNFSISPTVQVFRPAGQKYTTVTALNREQTDMSLDGIPTYTEIVYPLSSVLTEAVITAPAGTTGAASGSRVMGDDSTHWFFMPSAHDADSPIAYTVYQGSVARSHRASYTQLTEFGITINRNDTGLSGAAIGKAIEDDQYMPGNEFNTVVIDATGGTYTLTFGGQTTSALAYDANAATVLAALEALSTIPTGSIRVEDTGTLTYTVEFGGSLGETDQTLTSTATGLTGGAGTATVTETKAGGAISSIGLEPILPTQVCIYAFDAAQTDINTATNETATYQLTGIMEVEWTVGNRYTPRWTIDCTESSYTGMVEVEPTMQLRLRMEADAEGMNLLTNLRTGDTKFFRIRCHGGTIDDDAAQYYEFTLDFAGKMSDAGDLSDQDGVFATEWTFDGVPELANDGPVEISVVNNVTAL
jgi:hypothetical protein